ncbi:MAG: acyl-CoA dehydrogenase [Myxococcota bacterium]|jgi:alkylation response protein AidB-like acyl-CoA dehydrogenase
MSATEYTLDLRDIRFVLFEQLKVDEVLKDVPKYGDFDRDLYDTMLDSAADIARTVLAPINKVGDRVGCKFDGKGNVTTPPGFKEAYKTLAEAGLVAAGMSPDHGGIGLPHAIDVAMHEMLTGSNTAFSIYPGLSRASANLLASHYTPEWLRNVVVPRLVGGQWGGTMCLTEAGAGTAVGDNRTKAERTDEDGVYLLTGEKIFISGGDNDMTENICHLVLARAPDAPPGTRGISIFLVPKFDFDASGTLGERNDIRVVGIEHKMGINGSATCSIALGANGPCKGWRLGKEGQGMEIMFHMMNEARIGVGIQSVSIASSSWLNALSYAQDRVQGSSIDNMREGDPPRVTINQHPDVRRMLMTMKVQVETMRSLVYTVANRHDRAENGQESEREYLLGLVELMTPIVKSHCSDVGFDVCTLAVQVYGGYGYTGEYPVEQNLRDSKINSIYEGTNGIQAMDLLGRKMRKGNGALFMSWLNECNLELEAAKATKKMDEEVSALERARDQLGQTAMYLGGLGMQGNLKGAMLQSSPFLTLFGTVVLGLHAIWQSRVALEALEKGDVSPADQKFYRGKVLNAKFYTKNILPKATALAKSIQAGDESCLEAGLFE